MSSTCVGVVAELAERARHRLVHELHRAAADELLRLDERELGLDAGGVAVHHQPDRAGGREHASPARCGTRAARRARSPRPTTASRRRASPRARARRRSRRPRRGACASRGASRRRWARSPRTAPSPRRSARWCGRPSPVMSAVIAPAHARPWSESYGKPARHQQRAEVRVAEPELAERPGVLADLLGRVVGLPDHDLLGGEHDLDRVPEARRRRSCPRRRGTSSGSGWPGCTRCCPGACTPSTGSRR